VRPTLGSPESRLGKRGRRGPRSISSSGRRFRKRSTRAFAAVFGTEEQGPHVGRPLRRGSEIEILPREPGTKPKPPKKHIASKPCRGFPIPAQKIYGPQGGAAITRAGQGGGPRRAGFRPFGRRGPGGRLGSRGDFGPPEKFGGREGGGGLCPPGKKPFGGPDWGPGR